MILAKFKEARTQYISDARRPAVESSQAICFAVVVAVELIEFEHIFYAS